MISSQLGALANLRQPPKDDKDQARLAQASPQDSPRLADSMRPRPQVDPAQFEQRFQENKSWISDPKTQAALLGFAVNIMQPVGGNGGFGDFVGALGRSLGAGASAAAGVEESDREEAQLAREDQLNERKMRVEEATVGLSARELGLRERQFLSTATANKTTKVVSSDDPLNESLGLGIPEGMNAKVTITTDENGNAIAGNVEGEFGSAKEDKYVGSAQEIVDLYDAADEAERAGRTDLAQGLRTRAKQLEHQYSFLGAGQMFEFDTETGAEGALPNANAPVGSSTPTAPLDPQAKPQASVGGAATGGAVAGTQAPATAKGVRVVNIPGSKADLEMRAADAKDRERIATGLQDALVVRTAIDKTRTALAESNLPPDWFVTGGLGRILSSGFFPIPNQAQVVAKQLDILKAKVGFGALQALREASPTGGAVGNVSDAENKLLQSTLVSLDQFQGGQRELEESLLTLQFLFDPDSVAKRGELSQAVQSGRMTEAEALNKFQEMKDAFVYGEDINQEPLMDITTPPEYISPEGKEFWNDMPHEKRLLFLNPEDYKRAGGK